MPSFITLSLLSYYFAAVPRNNPSTIPVHHKSYMYQEMLNAKIMLVKDSSELYVCYQYLQHTHPQVCFQA